jgi:beta-lactamase regulating signal transducer with metallopeptidase domain
MHLLFNPRWALPVGWALLHFLWQGALVALMLSMLLHIIRRNEMRYLLSCGALILCLLLPCGTVAQQLRSQRSAEVLDFMVTPRAERPVASVKPQIVQGTFWQRMETSIRLRLPWMVSLWVLGCTLMAMRLGSGWLLASGWRRRSGIPPEPWTASLVDLARRMRMQKTVRLLSSHLVDSPMTLGLWRPVILVPASLFTGMAPELLEALLAHELAHIRRHDYLINLLQSFVEVLLFYHPAVWWISRRIRIERELLADDLAAKVLGEPRRLALALNALDDLQPHLPTPALAARGGHLMNRIHRLLRPTQDPRKISAPVAWLAPALLAAALLTPLAAAVVQEAKTESTKIYVSPILVQKIDALAQKESIDPNLLRAIAFVESHFNPEAVSAHGAKGILQVMPETALKYGATNLDDPEQVAAAGAHYLRHLLDVYQGDLTKAVSAYNGGEAAVNSGQLSDETRAYTPQVLKLVRLKAVDPASYLQQANISGEILATTEGDLKMRLWIKGAIYEVEVVPEGEAKAVCKIMVGSRDAAEKPGIPESANRGKKTGPESELPRESNPVVVFKNKSPGKRLRIRCTETPGGGRWGEAFVDLASLPVSFAFNFDHEATAN